MQYTSRTFLLKWLNSIQISIEKIEDIGKGAVLCTLIKKIDQEFPPFKKEPWNENDYIYNLKLVQLYLNKKGIKMYFPIEKMIKLKLQDNLEVIQQFYRYVMKEMPSLGINEGTDARGFTVNSSKNSKNETIEIQDRQPGTEKLKELLEICQNERDDYLGKLLEIEKILKEIGNENLSEMKYKILGVLYQKQH
jgi:RP/EB family microtubule-associated protein